MILTSLQIEHMRYACNVVKELHEELEKKCVIGTKLKDLNDFVEKFIYAHKCKPNFKGVGGFPASVCISLNDEVVHGIPDNRVIKDGDVVKIDLGCSYNGIHADAARTVLVGQVSNTARQLAQVTKQSFFEGIKGLKAGCNLNQIGYQVEKYVKKHGFSVVKDMCGHGIGTKLHMSPEVLNYDNARSRLIILKEHEALAIEPMVNEFGFEVDYNPKTLLCKTKDGGLSCHYENTVLITKDGCEILTL